MPRKDKTGQKFNLLTVLRRAYGVYWVCRCDCGKETTVHSSGLTTGSTKSCGCLLNRRQAKDLVGQKFGQLLVLSFYEESKPKEPKWVCLCKCGKETIVKGGNLKTNHTRSCGCIKIEAIRNKKRTHGQSKTREYAAWRSMLNRCYNKSVMGYADYGGRGITVCERWRASFENFYADMGSKPSPRHSLDRYPNNESGHYEPDNCRWATQRQQANNTRANRWIDYDGRRMTQKQWAEELNISHKKLHWYNKTGKPFDQTYKKFKKE